MKGELLITRAEQGYYPPRIEFGIRLKNDEAVVWHNFTHKGIWY